MKGFNQQKNLSEVLTQLQEAALHLHTSWLRCQNLENENTEDALIEFEALTSRFARLTDMLIHKVYRSIDAVEFVERGTLKVA